MVAIAWILSLFTAVVFAGPLDDDGPRAPLAQAPAVPSPADSIGACTLPSIYQGAFPGGPLEGQPATVVIHPGTA